MAASRRDAVRKWSGLWLVVAACVSLSVGSSVVRASSGPDPEAYVPGRLIVSFKSEVTAAERAAIGSRLGVRSSRPLNLAKAEVWEIGEASVSDAVSTLRQDHRVLYAEPDYIVNALEIPNDPMFGQLWGLHNSGQTGGTPGADVDAVRAWDVSPDAQDVVIGVIDTGVAYDHPDLAANMWTNPGEVAGDGLDNDGNGYVDDLHGYDFYNLDGDPWDDNRHGTHCAGTIAAVGNNGTGVVGVAWTAKIMALKFLGSDGVGSVSRAVLALEYATLMHARIVSNSWGGGGYSATLEGAIGAAYEAGILFVAACGNNGLDNDVLPFYPASYDIPNVVSVAATDHNDNLAGFSNYGMASVDLGAPGENILSAIPDGSYEYLSGTSMAAPHVSGVAALVWGRFPSMEVDDVKTLILASADSLPSLAGRCLAGGRLNAFRSISEPDTIPPAAVGDLVAENPGSNTMDLRWTATGDDGFSGRATTYDLRYSTSPIDETNFYDAHEASAPRPGPPGALERATVAGLEFSATCYFALRVADEYGSLSEVSNLAAGTTLGVPDIAVDPSSLDETLLTGARSSQMVAVRNVGEGTLDLVIPPPTLVFGSLALAEFGESGGAALGAGEEASPADPVAAPQAMGKGGPDAWGYRWIDSDQPGGPAFQWVDITEIGTPIALSGDDETSGPYPIGFDFEFYGNTFNQFWVCTNGFLSFTSTSTAYYNRPLPSADAPENLVALLWRDLSVPAENIFYHCDGARLIVEWYEVNPLGSQELYTFQAILYPSGEIVYQYLLIEEPAYYGTVGIQNATKDDGLLVAYNLPYVHSELAVLITRIPLWVSVRPSSGRVYGADSLLLSVDFDATWLAGGDYSANLIIASNDPDERALTIPVGLHVTGGPDVSVWPGTLDFGAVFVGDRKGLGLTVTNPGDQTLEVVDIALDDSSFNASPRAFTLESRASQTVAVDFAPYSDGIHPGLLTVLSNDPDESTVDVPIQGVGLLPPDVSVSPDSLSGSLRTGDTWTEVLTVANQGFNDLAFDVRVAMGAPLSVVAEAIRRHHRANLLPRAEPTYPAVAASTEEGSRDGERLASRTAPSSMSVVEELVGPAVWESRSPLAQPRAQHGFVTAPDGRVFAFGGYAGGLVSSMEIYDPVTDLWTVGTSVPAPDRGMPCAADTGGNIYYFGAIQGNSYRYDAASNTWASITPPPHRRLWGARAATGTDGRIYVFGGEGSQSENPLNLVQIYDPRTGTWTLGSPMPTARYHLGAAVAPGGFIYTMGGRAGSEGAPLATVEVYDPDTDTWSGAPPMPTARNQLGVVSAGDGRIYAIGGKYSYFNNEGPFFDAVEVYDPLNNTWHGGPSLSGGRGELGAALSGATIYAAGGTGGDFVALNEALITLNYLHVRPSSGTVAPSASLGLDVAVDAAGLAGGDYLADIFITTNDPDEIETRVPVHLHVTGAPDIAVSARSLSFGKVYVGTVKYVDLRIRNTGADALEVGGIVPDNGDYSASPSVFILDPTVNQDISVGFAPSQTGSILGALTILSNDPREPALVVSLCGEGVLAPEMSVSPDSLAVTLPPGGGLVATLTVTNSGGSDLAFEIDVAQLSRLGLPHDTASGAPAAESAGSGGPRGSAGHNACRLAAAPSAELPVGYESSTEPDETAESPATDEAAAVVVVASGPTLFRDDFEDGNYEGWFDSGGAGAKEVTDQTAAGGRYSYHEYHSPGGHFTGIYKVLAPIQPGYIDFWIRSGSSATSAAYFVLLDSGGSDVIWFFARRTGFFYVNADVGGDESHAYTANTWYHVEFKDVNYVDKTFDYFVDDALIKADIPFRNAESVSDISRLDLYNLDAGSEAWWDEIRLMTSEPAGWVSVTPASGVVTQGASLDFDVVLDASDLQIGIYQADLVIVSNDPDQPEARVPVRLCVSDRAEITVQPDTLGAVSTPRTVRILALRIGNVGIGDLNYSVVPVDSGLSAASPPQWVTVEPSGGTISAGEYNDLGVRLDARGLRTGLHTAFLRIASNDPVRQVIYVPIHLGVVNATPRPHEDLTPSDSADDHAGVIGWVPTEFALGQNRPNPFSLTTAIVFDLPMGTEVRLDVFDVRGELVVRLVEGMLAAGRHSVTWSGEDRRGGKAAPGVYFYRIRAGEWTQTRRTLLVK